MKGISAIVPVKPLRRAKSRLAGVLRASFRMELSQDLLRRTIRILSELKEVEQVLVVSRDPKALGIARDLGARPVQEDGTASLNQAILRATAVAELEASCAVLVIPADLPLLAPGHVRALLSRAGEPPVVVIAPDRHRRGTNALLLSPPRVIQIDFGEASFHKHCERARSVGATLKVVELPALGLDLDLPEDLELADEMRSHL